MQNLTEKNYAEIFCPRCGGKNELDSLSVKYCRFCGLAITESRDAVRGLTLMKKQGRAFTVWGYLTLQILFLVILLYFITSLPLWTSALCLIIFALSNGFFIAGSFAAENPSALLLNPQAKKYLNQSNSLPKDTSGNARQSITEHTMRKLI